MFSGFGDLRRFKNVYGIWRTLLKGLKGIYGDIREQGNIRGLKEKQVDIRGFKGIVDRLGVIKENRNTSLVAKGALAHRLQRHTTCKIQNARRRLERCLPQNFGPLQLTFAE